MKYLSFFLALWTLVILAACQTDTVEPIEPGSYERNVGDLFNRDFILDLQVEGTRFVQEPLANALNDDPHAGELPGCLGPSDIVGWGYGTSGNEVYQTRTTFVFDAMSHSSNGKIKLEYENPNQAYVFELYGYGFMDNGYHNSDFIRIPLRMVSSTYPIKGKFIGDLYIDNPDILHCISDDVVRVPGHIRGQFYATE